MIDSYNISGVDTKWHERYTKVQNMQIDMSFCLQVQNLSALTTADRRNTITALGIHLFDHDKKDSRN